MQIVPFNQYRIILQKHLCEDCINVIELYYNQLVYNDSLVYIKIKASPIFNLGVYYNKSFSYIFGLLQNSIDENTVQNICRYWIYNQDYIGSCRNIFKSAVKRLLVQTKWNMSAYYYEQIFFKPLLQI